MAQFNMPVQFRFQQQSANDRGHRSTARRQRSTGLVFVVFTVLAALVSTLSSPVSAQGTEVRTIHLPIPVSALDDVRWSDTWGAPRSGGRSHEGVDILGPQMTPLLAAADGTVTWLRHDTSRGNNLVITDDDGWKYHYIHINNDTPGTDDGVNNYDEAFGPGIADGVRVTAGQVVAYMGDSGNAENCCHHLHFEIETPDGRAINPTPSVDAARAFALSGGDRVSGSQDIVDQAYGVLRGRAPSDAERSMMEATIQRDGLGTALVPLVDADSWAASIDRLYYAVFVRLPDPGGFGYWIDEGNDVGLLEVSEYFAVSPEYQIRFAGRDFDALLDQIYLELFDREPDEEGKAYWMEKLENDRAVTPGTILAHFTQSQEAKNVAGVRSEIVALTALFNDGEMPSEAAVAEWAALRATTSLPDAIDQTFVS